MWDVYVGVVEGNQSGKAVLLLYITIVLYRLLYKVIFLAHSILRYTTATMSI